MEKHNIPMENAENMISDVIKSIAKPIESALKAELDMHLGYAKNQISANNNYRNGYFQKNVKPFVGKTTINIPCDRNVTFEQQRKRHF